MEHPAEKRAAQGKPTQRRRGRRAALQTPHAFLIRIPDREARKRAIMAFLDVRDVYHAFPDHEMLVGREHLEVLRREGIPFEALS